MKRLIVTSALMITTASLFIMCRESNKTENNDTITQAGNTKMTRVKTGSGLEYEILEAGSGESPKAGNLVTVHYTGWLNNNGQPGEMFDSSVKRNKPFVFKIGVGQVIKGWDEGVMTMKIGEKRRLFIPADLAYGSRSMGPVIHANANLIFDVELISIAG